MIERNEMTIKNWIRDEWECKKSYLVRAGRYKEY